MDTKEKIISAAIEVFAEKGKHGARMEQIAAKAKVNKAMLYYYYSSKDNLFREMLKTITQKIFRHVFSIVSPAIAYDESPIDKVKRIVSAHFEAFSQNSNFAKIAVQALANEPHELRSAIKSLKGNMGGTNRAPIEFFLSIFKEGVSRKELRDVDPKQVLISIVGMNLVYFTAKPVAEALLNLNVEDDQAFLRERKESIIDLVLHGIAQR
jgi:TetR/AcrR family transcriptional regulator